MFRSAIILLALVTVTGNVGAQIAFEPPTSYPIATEPDGVALADLNGDQWPDMILTADGPDRIVVRTNGGAGTFGGAVNVALGSGSSPHSLVATNVDNDADVDLVVTLQDLDQVQILMNSGGVLTAGAKTNVGGTEPRYIAAADLDGNGFPDIVTSNRGSDDVSVLFNAAGVLASGTIYAVGGDPRGLVLADVDGDQLPDVIVASHDTRQVTVLLNQASKPGELMTGPLLEVGGELRPEGVGAKDLDRDGDVDIIATTSGNGNNFVTVFLNLGTSSFAPPVNYPTGGLNPSAVLVADFDLDGLRDLAVANQDSSNLSILRNLGGGSFAAAQLFDVGTNPQALAGADLERNGSIDLACVNQNSNTVTVFRNALSALLFVDGFESRDTSAWSRALP